VLLVLLVSSWLAWDCIRDRSLQGRLLQAAPDSLPNEPQLMAYALPRGQVGYRDHCRQCHGEQLQGNPASGVPNLADSDWLYGTGRVVEIERVVLYGIRSGLPRSWNLADMPAFARPEPYARYKISPLNARQVSDVTTYLLSLRDKSQDPAAAARGSAVYQSPEQGQCVDCHTNDARGDNGIGAPDLTDAVWLYGDGSRAAIERSIEAGRAGTCPGWRARLPPAQIREIALFVYSRRIHQ